MLSLEVHRKRIRILNYFFIFMSCILELLFYLEELIPAIKAGKQISKAMSTCKVFYTFLVFYTPDFVLSPPICISHVQRQDFCFFLFCFLYPSTPQCHLSTPSTTIHHALHLSWYRLGLWGLHLPQQRGKDVRDVPPRLISCRSRFPALLLLRIIEWLYTFL